MALRDKFYGLPFIRGVLRRLDESENRIGSLEHTVGDMVEKANEVHVKEQAPIVENLETMEYPEFRKKRAHEIKNNILDKSGEIKNISVIQENLCCGCSACGNTCPNGAILFEKNIEGFLYPKVDSEKCTNCSECLNVCPAVNVCGERVENQVEYAVKAKDENLRKSTTGGAFITLAKWCIDEGGYVCGPVNDGLFKVNHVVANDMDTVIKMASRKYTQSDMKNCFKEIKTLLDENKKVMFTGLACQVAGLRNYLKNDFENLITVDVECFGNQSPDVYEKYIKEKYDLDNIEEVSQTDKHVFGRGQLNGTVVTYKDGTKKAVSERFDSFYKSIKNGLNMRKSCGDCSYRNYNQIADISLRHIPNHIRLEATDIDNKDISLLAVNTPKGEKVYEATKELFAYNYRFKNNLELKSEVVVAPKRDYFFNLLRKTTLDKAVSFATQDKYDVAVIGLWYGRNYGSMITYYALHQVLSSLNLSVLMVNNALLSGNEVFTDKTNPRLFAENRYNISEIFPLSRLEELNNHADAFLIGSDQLWNYYLSRPYKQMYYLDFVHDDKKRIAYGTSFGSSSFNGPADEVLRVKENLGRFDFVSVREEYAVDVCRDTFGVESVKVLDPVFLCEREEYHKLTDEISHTVNEKYILGYILDPDAEKTVALERLAEKYDCRAYVILDEPPWKFKENCDRMGLKEDSRITILHEVEVREWLSWIKNASYVVTDSFHGSCFAIIFERQFMSFVNNRRGGKRFYDLLERFNLQEYMVEDASKLLELSKLDDKIDYDKVYEIINEDKKFSMNWLKNALFSQKVSKTDAMYEKKYETN